MIRVTQDFIDHLKTSRSFEYSARIVLTDGRVLNLTEDDLELSGCSLKTAMDSEEFIVGNAVSQRLSLAFYNPYDQYIGYDFYMAKVYPSLKFWFTDETGETINFGEFTVAEPEGYGSTITLTAYDELWRTDKPFEPNEMQFPITAQELFDYCCFQCSLPEQVDPIPNGDYQIMKAPEDVSYRQVLGYIAMLGAGNVVIKEGRATVLSYLVDLLDRPSYDGGYFGEPAIPYTSGDVLDGLYFTDPDTVEAADAAFHGYEAHGFSEPYQGTTVGTDDVVITGVSITGEVEIEHQTIDDDGQIETTTETEEQTFMFGTEGYVLDVENALFAGNYDDGVERVGRLLIGIRFRPFEMSVPCYPIAEIGDCCYIINAYGRQFLSFITEIDHPFHSATTLKCSASDPVRNTSNYAANNAVVKAIKAARAEMQNVMSRYEVEMNRMSGMVANALGFYETREIQPDGSIITYLHNHVTLDTSDIIWKRTAQGLVVSTDGGHTWNAGIDAQGNAVLNMLSVKGIQWEWARGGTLTLGGINNSYGVLNIVDANNANIGTWNKDGITANGKIRSTASSGYFAELGIARLQMGDRVAGGDVTRGEIVPAYLSTDATTVKHGLGIRTVGGEYISLGHNPGIGSNAVYYLLNNGANPNGWTQRHIFTNPVRYNNAVVFNTASRVYFLQNSVPTEDVYNADAYFYINTRTDPTELTIGPGSLKVRIYGQLEVDNGKHRVVATKYGAVLLNSFETANCHFSDIGSGKVGDDGLVYVFFDPVFAETIDQKAEYQVLITRTSEAATEWVEKCPGYFIVHGEPGATFDWMLIGYQRDFTTERLCLSDFDRNPPSEDGTALVNDSDEALSKTTQSVDEYDYTATEKILDQALLDYEKEIATL